MRSSTRAAWLRSQAHGLDTDPLYESLNGSDTLLATAHLRARLGQAPAFQVTHLVRSRALLLYVCMYMYLYLYLSLSIYLSIYLYVYPAICISI